MKNCHNLQKFSLTQKSLDIASKMLSNVAYVHIKYGERAVIMSSSVCESTVTWYKSGENGWFFGCTNGLWLRPSFIHSLSHLILLLFYTKIVQKHTSVHTQKKLQCSNIVPSL